VRPKRKVLSLAKIVRQMPLSQKKKKQLQQKLKSNFLFLKNHKSLFYSRLFVSQYWYLSLIIAQQNCAAK
jgi:hypothetical protein